MTNLKRCYDLIIQNAEFVTMLILFVVLFIVVVQTHEERQLLHQCEQTTSDHRAYEVL